MAYDFDQIYGDDIALATDGSVSLVGGTTLGEQRVLRRLLTNPGDYVWHPDYGAGLPRYVGTNLDTRQIEGVIRDQLTLESVVAANPVPVVKFQRILNGVVVTILWVDADTREQAALSFDLTQ